MTLPVVATRPSFRAHAGFAAALVAVLSVSACGKPKDDNTAPTPDPARTAVSDTKPVVVRFARAEEKLLPQTLELSGALAADETSEVATPVAGAVVAVKIDVGSRVKKGDVLVQLDPRDAALRAAQANATADQARARLNLAQGGKFEPGTVPDVRAAKEAMDLAVADADRTKALFDAGSLPQATWDQVRSRAEQAKAQYDAAVSGAKQSYASLNAAQASAGLSSKQLGDAAIRAPFDGSVAEKRVAPGEFAAVGRVVAVVVRDNPLRLKLDVAEADLGKVEIGKKVSLVVAAFPDRRFEGVVKRVGASLRAQSRTLPIEADVPNDEGLLRPGLFARAYVSLPGADTKAMLVPRAAVGTTGANSRVFVHQGEKVIEVLVRTGRVDGDRVEIIGNVPAGAEIATTNLEALSDGASVTGSLRCSG